MNQQKIKLMFVTPSLTTGGAERMAVDLLAGLNKDKFEVILVLFGHEVVENVGWAEELEKANIRIERLYSEKIIKLGKIGGIIRAVSLSLKFWRLIKKEQPVIIHGQLFGDLYSRIVGLAARIPVLISTEQNVNHIEPRILSFIKKLTANYITKTVAISHAVKIGSMIRYGIREDKIIIIYNSVSVEKFYKALESPQPAHDPFVFASIGRLSEQKGYNILIEAMVIVHAKYPTAICRIAGEGEDRKIIEELIISHNLSQTIFLLGVEQNIPKFLASSDCFVMPSLWEGLGIAALEAGLSGIPMIVSRIDGLAEIVGEDNGMLVPAGDSKALAQAMIENIRLKGSSILFENSRRLQKNIINNFSLVKMVREYENLYISLLSEHYANK